MLPPSPASGRMTGGRGGEGGRDGPGQQQNDERRKLDLVVQLAERDWGSA